MNQRDNRFYRERIDPVERDWHWARNEGLEAAARLIETELGNRHEIAARACAIRALKRKSGSNRDR